MAACLWTLPLASDLAFGDETAATAETAPAEEKIPALQVVPFSPAEYAKTGIAWQVVDSAGEPLSAPELATALGDPSVTEALKHSQRTGRLGALGFGLVGTYLLGTGAIAVLDSAALVPYQAEDRALTGAFLVTGGVFAFSSAVLIQRGVHDRRAHPAHWWNQDEVTLQVADHNRSAP